MTSDEDGDLGVRRPSALLKTARDPSAAPDRLRRIVDVVRHASSGPRRAVLEAVASNPNAPPDVLAELVRTCPDAVRANPALPLLALEAPDCAALMDEARLRELLRDPSLPAGLLSVVAADASRPELASEARMHVGLAGEAVEGWQDEVRAWFRAHVRDCAPSAHFAYRELAELSLGPAWIAEELAGKPPLPEPRSPREEIAEAEERYKASFAHLYDPELSQTAAEAVLREFGGTLYQLHPLALALNPALSTELIRCLSKRATDVRVMVALAEHPNTPTDVLSALSAIEYWLVRRAVLRRPDAPPECHPIARSGALRPPLRWRGQYHRFSTPPSPLLRYVALTEGRSDPAWPAAVRRAADGDEWHERLAAVVALPEAEVPALVAPLAGDGNRYVRAAARARLADPTAVVLDL